MKVNDIQVVQIRPRYFEATCDGYVGVGTTSDNAIEAVKIAMTTCPECGDPLEDGDCDCDEQEDQTSDS